MQECWLYNNCNHKDCETFCIRKYKLSDLYEKSLLAPYQRSKLTLCVDSDGTDYTEFVQLAEIEKNIMHFVNSGNNLYLHSSNCGNGKSSWAIKLIQAYFNKIWPKATLDCHALFISVPRFLQALKDNISKPNEYANFIKDNIMRADLVVFDDIATKAGSEFEISQLLSYIDGRIALGKSNIYTSNLNFREMQSALGERLASRVCQMSTDIELHGSDKRSLKLKEDGE